MQLSSHRAPRSLSLYASCAIATVLASSGVTAQEAQAIQWREAFVTVESEIRPVEGHEGHFVGMSRQRGFAFYEDEDTATVSVFLTFERSGPSTSYRGYAVYTFPDDSTKGGYFTGSGDPMGQQSGDFVFQGGTGRFEGITGEGSFAGRGFPPDGDIYLNVSGIYSLPD